MSLVGTFPARIIQVEPFSEFVHLMDGCRHLLRESLILVDGIHPEDAPLPVRERIELSQQAARKRIGSAK